MLAMQGNTGVYTVYADRKLHRKLLETRSQKLPFYASTAPYSSRPLDFCTSNSVEKPHSNGFMPRRCKRLRQPPKVCENLACHGKSHGFIQASSRLPVFEHLGQFFGDFTGPSRNQGTVCLSRIRPLAVGLKNKASTR